MWEVFSRNRRTGKEATVVTETNQGESLTEKKARSLASRCSYADSRPDVSYDARKSRKSN